MTLCEVKIMCQSEIEERKKATIYCDRFSKVYDVFSPKAFYHKARLEAVKQLHLGACPRER